MDVAKKAITVYSITLTEDEAREFIEWYSRRDVVWGHVAGEISTSLGECFQSHDDE